MILSIQYENGIYKYAKWAFIGIFDFVNLYYFL